MSVKKDDMESLESALKYLMSLIRVIRNVQKDIDDKWGVRLRTTYIPGIDGSTADVNVRRGIEEIEKALEKESKIESYSYQTKVLRHQGIEFRQYADDKTKVFIKAGQVPPKVKIVEDKEE